ncbi:MAG: hypothetical protein J1G06_00655 [Oscillospiraceae bacterium]|nr:hypothetical protein [Oscillospiraceae bacterium]
MAEKKNKNAVGKTEKEKNISKDVTKSKNAVSNSVKEERPQEIESMAPEVDERIKYYILAIAAVLVVAVVFMVAFCSNTEYKKSNKTNAAVTEQESASSQPEKVYPLQFRYFVTKSDENYDEYMAMISEIEEKYEDQVMFTITDIDDDPVARDNFPVDVSGTPMLIVVKSTGDIFMEGKCADRDKIVGYIEDAIGDAANQ